MLTNAPEFVKVRWLPRILVAALSSRGTLVVRLITVALPLLCVETPHLREGLLGLRTAPVLIRGLAAEPLSSWAVPLRHFQMARGEVASLLFRWGLAQNPYLIKPDVTVQKTVAPEATLIFVPYAIPVGKAFLLPSLWFLFRMFKAKES